MGEALSLQSNADSVVSLSLAFSTTQKPVLGFKLSLLNATYLYVISSI